MRIYTQHIVKWVICLFFLAVIKAYPQAPPGYYDAAGGLSGQALFDVLSTIIKNHQQQTYNSLWIHFETTDIKTDSTVWCMYSDNPGGLPPYQYTFFSDQCGTYSKEGDCYNREHSWPSSWLNNSYPAYTDLFHLYPVDGYVNNKRGNFPYGMVSTPTWTSQNGSKLGPNVFPGYNGVVFEPIDEFKGDFARSFFYMATRYYTEDALWAVTDMTDKASLKPWAVQLLYMWHLADTVSDKEIQRNEAVFAIQGNRNPYIDYPFWVEAIWGPNAGLNNRNPLQQLILFPNPSSDYCMLVVPESAYGNLLLNVYSLQGKIIYSKITGEKPHIILNTQALPQGLYILEIISAETRESVNHKLIIEH